jgi:hypothetical protein
MSLRGPSSPALMRCGSGRLTLPDQVTIPANRATAGYVSSVWSEECFLIAGTGPQPGQPDAHRRQVAAGGSTPRRLV